MLARDTVINMIHRTQRTIFALQSRVVERRR